MTIRKLTAADEPIFYEMCEEFFHSSAVSHPIPMAHHVATFQELLQSDTYLFGYLMEVDGEPAGFAIASLVLGIISLVLSCTMINIITGILALVFGIVHMVKYQSRKGMAIAGIVLGIISIVIMIILIVVGVAVMATPEWQTMINEL